MFHWRFRLVTDLNTALVQSFLDITLAEGKAVGEPKSVLNDAQREGGGGKAYGPSQAVSLSRLTCQNPDGALQLERTEI